VKDNIIIYQDSDVLIGKTNNEAEYSALLAAIKWMVKEGYKTVICYMDSELVYRQLIGEYQVKNPSLHLYYQTVKEHVKLFDSITFKWVPRTHMYIRVADGLNRQAIRRATV
jgi:ribonuclease HI